MSNDQKPETPKQSPNQSLLRRIAIGVLVIGLFISAVVYTAAPDADEDDYLDLSVASLGTSKKYQRELERVGGKSFIVITELHEWFDSLWHGKRLAGTLAIITVGISFLIFVISELPPFDEP